MAEPCRTNLPPLLCCPLDYLTDAADAADYESVARVKRYSFAPVAESRLFVVRLQRMHDVQDFALHGMPKLYHLVEGLQLEEMEPGLCIGFLARAMALDLIRALKICERLCDSVSVIDMRFFHGLHKSEEWAESLVLVDQ